MRNVAVLALYPVVLHLVARLLVALGHREIDAAEGRSMGRSPDPTGPGCGVCGGSRLHAHAADGPYVDAAELAERETAALRRLRAMLGRTLLRTAREALGCGVGDLAESAGCAERLVRRIEAGEVDPTLDTVERILNDSGLEVRAGPAPPTAATAAPSRTPPRSTACGPPSKQNARFARAWARRRRDRRWGAAGLGR